MQLLTSVYTSVHLVELAAAASCVALLLFNPKRSVRVHCNSAEAGCTILVQE